MTDYQILSNHDLYCDTEIKTGYLNKQRKLLRTWKRVYLVLTGNYLNYFDEKNEKEKCLFLYGDDVTCSLTNDAKKKHCFSINSNDRAVYLQASSDKECKEWVDIIQRVLHGDFTDEIKFETMNKLETISKNNIHEIYTYSSRKNPNRLYSVKKYNKAFILDKKKLNEEINKRKKLVQQIPRFIVPLRCIIDGDSHISLISDYYNTGLLSTLLQNEGRFTEKKAKYISAEILLALEEFHDAKIIYRNLKLRNILLSESNHIKLTDPGLLTLADKDEYSAPEILKNERSGIYSDCYSFGVILYELICGLPPFYDRDVAKMFDLILNSPVRFPHNISPEAKSLLKKLLDKSRATRLRNTELIKKDSFYSDINWEEIRKSITPW